MRLTPTPETCGILYDCSNAHNGASAADVQLSDLRVGFDLFRFDVAQAEAKADADIDSE